jgi:hypothetical protein
MTVIPLSYPYPTFEDGNIPLPLGFMALLEKQSRFLLIIRADSACFLRMIRIMIRFAIQSRNFSLISNFHLGQLGLTICNAL